MTILALFLWLVLFIQPPIVAYMLAMPPLFKPKGNYESKKNHDGPQQRNLLFPGQRWCFPSPPRFAASGRTRGGVPDILVVTKIFNDFPPLPSSSGASQRGGSPNSSSTLLSAVASSSPPPCGHSLCPDVLIILCISPKSGSKTMGYIFLNIHERQHKAPVSAYFGHEIVPFPYPDFNTFLCATYLCTRDVSFVGNLPHYIIPTG